MWFEQFYDQQRLEFPCHEVVLGSGIFSDRILSGGLEFDSDLLNPQAAQSSVNDRDATH